jgi:hypothetical protein
MAALSATITTATSDMAKAWKKIQAKIAQAIQFENVEWDMFDEFFAPEGTPWSAREVTVPLDINKKGGIASIKEGGYEARPHSKNLEELTITLVHFNGRFNISKLAKFGDEGSRNQVTRDLSLRGLQTIRAMGEHWSDYVYGYSTGRLARTSTNATQSSGAYTLDQGYDSTVTNAAYIADKFRVGDRVALIRSSALVTNGIGEITAINTSTPTITVTWGGSTDSDANDLVVKANSAGNTDVNDTDSDRGLVGFLDMAKTASVHSLSSSSVPDWDVATADTAGGRMTGLRLRQYHDEIADEGGGKATHVLTTRGVYRDLIDLERPAVRFSDPLGMEIDGNVKMKGIKIVATKKVPPGYLFTFDKSALSRWNLLPKPDGSFAWSDGKEYIDQSGFVFAMDMPCATIIKNRKKLAYASGLTES